MIKNGLPPLAITFQKFFGGLPLAVEAPVHVPNPIAISKLYVAIDKLGR